MSEPENIKAFNFLTLFIFTKIYEEFPRKIDFNGRRIIIEAAFDYGAKSDEASYMALFSDTINWLEAEGFITVQAKTFGSDYIGVTLTLRGLTVLGYLPSSLDSEGKSTIIESAREIVASGFKSASTDAVGSVVKSAFVLMAGYAQSII